MKHLMTLCLVLVMSGTSAFGLLYDRNIYPDVIFGNGNANGSWTVGRDYGVVELGLRAKLRFDENGQPQNTFNSNGDGTYTFNAGIAPTKLFPTAEWCFEWSIHSDWDNNQDAASQLDDLTYSLSMTSNNGAYISAFDPINDAVGGVLYWDHAIGDSTTGNGGGTVAADAAEYANLIATKTLAQNSWQPHWFATSFNPTEVGEYYFTLTASSGGTTWASTAMTVEVVPEPATLALLGLGGVFSLISRKRKTA